MTPKEIKQNMTQGEWVCLNESGCRSIFAGETHIREEVCDTVGKEYEIEDAANAQAITTAVKATYGHDLNPEGYEECIKALKEIMKNIDSRVNGKMEEMSESMFLGYAYNECKSAITKSKL